MQPELTERMCSYLDEGAIPQGECPVDIQATEPQSGMQDLGAGGTRECQREANGAEVSRGHSTLPVGRGRAEHRTARKGHDMLCCQNRPVDYRAFVTVREGK